MSPQHYDLSEAYRKLAAMIRFGTITGVDLSDATAPRVTCTCGGLDTDMLPWHAQRAGKTSHWSAPTVGEQVIVFAPGGETSLGFVLGGFYSSNNPAPSTDPNVDMTQYPDGSTVVHDSNAKSHTITVPAGGNITLQVGSTSLVLADGKATLNAQQFEHVGDQATFDGAVTVTKLLTWLAGVAGNAGSGGGANAIDGGVNVVNGDVTADGIGLKSHTHTDPQGGTVGPAQG